MAAGARGEPVSIDLLVAGGERDPNLPPVLEAAARRGLEVRSLRVGPGAHPRLHWDLEADSLRLEGETLRPRAVFLRHDVFAWLADPREEVADRARAWQDTLVGWLRAHPEVRWLNRHAPRGSGQKPADLVLARRCGLAVPRTVLSNDAAAIGALAQALPGGGVAKPVSGGQHCRPLDAALAQAPRQGGALPSPALVQARLEGPDLRVYLVGAERLAFRLAARTLDVREDPEVAPEPVALPASLEAPLRALQEAAALDLAAVDLKAPPGAPPVFLECNRQPMHAAFDEAVAGGLSAAILRWLCPPARP